MDEFKARIQAAKAKHQALILAHYYEDSEIQDLADHVGDSLYLAQQGEKASNPVILLAGVVFMAETVKILSPNKIVLAPDLKAGCSLVTHSPYKDYLAWRQQYPEALAVTYINSSAEVKAISDVIITSSNAEKIIRSIPCDREILFGPDQHLGKYLSKKIGRPMRMWPGACEVHVLFSAKKLFLLKNDHPEAVVLAHPECADEVLSEAHVIGSTSRLLDETKQNPATTFIVATEPGILHQMRKYRPDALFLEAPAEGSCACNQCPYMKLNTTQKIALTLENLAPQIHLSPASAEQARIPLQRMMALSRGEGVTWPKKVFNYEAATL